MKRIKFNSIAEFAKAIIENDLWDEDGNKYYFESISLHPFKTDTSSGTRIMETEWSYWNLTFTTTPPLQDKQPVEVWDNTFTHVKVLGFWDAINDGIYKYNGKRYGDKYDNYRPLTPEETPQWMIEAVKTLED